MPAAPFMTMPNGDPKPRLTFGEFVIKMRRDRGWTQAELAEKTGLGMGTISNIENDESDPKDSTIQRLAAAFAVMAFFQFAGPAICLPNHAAWAPDLVAASALQGQAGRMVVPFDWGEFAIWHFGPDLQVSTDGRRETIYRPQTLDTQHYLAFGNPKGFRFLKEQRPEYVWLRQAWSEPTKAWLIGHGYVIDIETDESFIARRADRPALPVPGRMTGCFP